MSIPIGWSPDSTWVALSAGAVGSGHRESPAAAAGVATTVKRSIVIAQLRPADIWTAPSNFDFGRFNATVLIPRDEISADRFPDFCFLGSINEMIAFQI